MTKRDGVDALKQAIGVETDLALAAKLGLDRSTVAQWRRRGMVPARYRFIADPSRQDDVRRGFKNRDRRELYGDGNGEYLLRAALAVVPVSALDFPELSPALLGDYRESTLINLLSVVLEVCAQQLGKPRPESEEDYEALVEALSRPAAEESLRVAMMRPALGERD